MAEEFVTEEELLGGDPALTADSTQNGMPNDERTYTGVYHFTDFDKETGDLLYMGHYSEFYNDVTADDLEQYFEQSEDLQSIFGSFDNYLSYMNERQDLIDSGVDLDWIGSVSETQEQVYEDRIRLQQLLLKETQGGTLTAEELAEKQQLEDAGVTPALLADVGMGAETEGSRSYTEAFNNVMQSEEMQARNEAYGIPSEFTNDSGDTMFWTGSGLAQKDKFNERYGQVIGMALFSIAASVIAGPVGANLTTALTNAGMSQALAAATSKAIMNSAVQLAVTGDVDITQALFSAAGTYLSQSGVEGILGDSEFGQALNDLADKAEGVITDFQDLISTGNSVADAAIQAGGMSMLIGLVEEGEVDVQQAIIAAGMAGGTEYLNQLAASGVVTQEEIDQYQEMGPPEELAGTDLDGDGITDTEVADGLFLLSDGTVVNADNETIGTMDELDINNDGQLTGADLQEIGSGDDDFYDKYAVPEEFEGTYTEYLNELAESQFEEEAYEYTQSDEFVGPDFTLGADYDPNTVQGQWLDNLSQDDFIHSNLTFENSAVANYVNDERQFWVINTPDGYYLTDADGNMVKYRGGDIGRLDELGSNIDRTGMYDSLDPLTQHLVAGGELPGTGYSFVDIDYDLSEDQQQQQDLEEQLEEQTQAELEDDADPESDILDSIDETLEGATGDPAAGAEPGGASLQELQQQYENAVNAGDLLLAEQIAEQIENLQTQPADATQPDSVTDPDVIDIIESEGPISTPIGPAPPGPVIVDDRTQWQKNKDYIISKVSAGEATAEQLEWYERWQAAGSPETQEGMGSGTGAEEGISTGEGGGLTGDAETGAPSPTSPETPVFTGVGGPTIGTGPSVQGPGMLDTGTGDPDIGGGIGGTGDGGTGDGGMLTQQSPFQMPDFKPLYTTIEYTTPTIQPIIVDNRKDYVRELDGLIDRGLFTSQKGIA